MTEARMQETPELQARHFLLGELGTTTAKQRRSFIPSCLVGRITIAGRDPEWSTQCLSWTAKDVGALYQMPAEIDIAGNTAKLVVVCLGYQRRRKRCEGKGN